jgi:hypothetical protein
MSQPEATANGGSALRRDTDRAQDNRGRAAAAGVRTERARTSSALADDAAERLERCSVELCLQLDQPGRAAFHSADADRHHAAAIVDRLPPETD